METLLHTIIYSAAAVILSLSFVAVV